MDKKESFFWDFVKGTAIFLMLWGHCIQYCALDTLDYFEDVVFKGIYTFHMPVFMLVSGYLFSYSFRKRDLKALLAHRMQGMLQPIVMATILSNLLLQVPNYILAGRVDVLFGSLFWGISESFWFLWAVLYCSLVVGICGKCTENPFCRGLLVVLGAFGILLLPQWNMTLFMYPYFAAGFFSGMYREHAKRLYRVLRYVMLAAFFLMVPFYETKHYIYITPVFSEELGLTASLEIAVFRWAIGFAGSISLLTVLDWFRKRAERTGAVGLCARAIACLGRNSLQIYCLSLPLLSGYLPHLWRKAAEILGGDLFAENIAVFDFLFTPLLSAAWSVFLYGLVVLLKKTRLHRLIFGR